LDGGNAKRPIEDPLIKNGSKCIETKVRDLQGGQCWKPGQNGVIVTIIYHYVSHILTWYCKKYEKVRQDINFWSRCCCKALTTPTVSIKKEHQAKCKLQGPYMGEKIQPEAKQVNWQTPFLWSN